LVFEFGVMRCQPLRRALCRMVCTKIYLCYNSEG
ncbi:disulfide bond formation protein DsbD, partial [Vibrio cholerae]